MSLLSYTELLELQKQEVILNSLPAQVNAASIDVTLGNYILAERPALNFGNSIIELSERKPLAMEGHRITRDGYLLQPKECILAETEQFFNLPNNITCEYRAKSSMARIFLDHFNAGWCDAGWNGSVFTLALRNMSMFHSIVLRPGDKIGQMIFFRHKEVPEEGSYATKGRYNNDKTAMIIKP